MPACTLHQVHLHAAHTRPDTPHDCRSLASFATPINNSARALTDRLELAAQEGSLFDIRPMIHAFTLDTIARVAFG